MYVGHDHDCAKTELIEMPMWPHKACIRWRCPLATSGGHDGLICLAVEMWL